MIPEDHRLLSSSLWSSSRVTQPRSGLPSSTAHDSSRPTANRSPTFHPALCEKASQICRSSGFVRFSASSNDRFHSSTSSRDGKFACAQTATRRQRSQLGEEREKKGKHVSWADLVCGEDLPDGVLVVVRQSVRDRLGRARVVKPARLALDAIKLGRGVVMVVPRV